jgi:glycosyltransferase involved in cell wall biosynthesis
VAINTHSNPEYILITPARNEEKYITKTIESMVSQTKKPTRWIIVNDGSTDCTKAVIEKYLDKLSWLELIDLQEKRERSFAAKASCFNAGYKRALELNYDYIGNLDADISFDPDYLEYLLEQFYKYPKLGVAGTPFVEDSGEHYDYRFTDRNHVSGACQIFKAECFNQIGGYKPVKGGGIDWIAVTTARMKGWETRTFTEKVCYHHRKMGTGQFSAWATGFKHGQKDYYLGGHPLWQLCRGIYQGTRKPYFVSGASMFYGYVWAWLKGVEKVIDKDLETFHRKEQMDRLKRMIGINGNR